MEDFPCCYSHKIKTWNTDSFKSFKYDGLNIRILFPKNYDSEKLATYPLLVYLHGYGARGPDTDNESQLELEGEFFKNLVDQDRFHGILFFPQSENGWYDNNLQKLKNAIEYMIQYRRVDPLRIIFRGYSNGAEYVWKFIESFPLLVSSGICLSGLPGSFKDIPNERYSEIPIWFAHGNKDQQLPLCTQVKTFFDYLQKNNLPIKYTEYPEFGHEVSKPNEKDLDLLPFLNLSNKLNYRINVKPVNLEHQKKGLECILSISRGFDEYQWKKDDQIIQSSNLSSLKIKQSGLYKVRVKYKGGWTYWTPNPQYIKLENLKIGTHALLIKGCPNQ